MKRNRNKLLRKKKIAEALQASHGIVAAAAKAMGCHRGNLWNRIKADPDLLQLVEDERAGLCDFAEMALKASVLKGDAWAVCFALKCLGKDRGYVERQQTEITGKDGGPIRLARAEELTDDELAAIARGSGRRATPAARGEDEPRTVHLLHESSVQPGLASSSPG